MAAGKCAGAAGEMRADVPVEDPQSARGKAHRTIWMRTGTPAIDDAEPAAQSLDRLAGRPARCQFGEIPGDRG
jgi:hypothetical protein